MLVFVDESGDTGLQFSQGSSIYFAVTLVIFDDNEEAEKLRLRIDALRKELRLPPTYEFHFFKNNVYTRRDFLNAVRIYNFRFFTLVADKRKLSGPEFQTRSSFYKMVCGVAFESAKHLLQDANVKFDDSGEKSAKLELASYIRKKVNEEGAETERIRRVGTQESKASNLIQVADMVSGAVYRSFQNEANAREYRNIIKHREYAVLLWPE